MQPLATIAPLEQAVKYFGEKSVVASKLRSKDWQDVPLALRDRAFFSSAVEDARFLSVAQAKISDALKMQREKVAGGEAIVDRSSFIGDLRKLALPISESANPFADTGLGNIASRARLGLIFDMQVQGAQGFANWKAGNDADVLDAFPAQELVRIERRKQPRDWPARWQQAGGKFFGGRMVALKTDPVWAAISRFGTPWPPFDFGSGMDVRDVSRAEAEDMGLLQRGENVEPTAEEDFNAELQASTEGLGGAFLSALKKFFGVQIKVADGSIEWTGKKAA